MTATREDQCEYVLGDAGPYAEAWLGLQRATRELNRVLESRLVESHGLSLSELELLGRLAVSEQHRRRLSRLASDVGLSLSRVSRIADSLERRGLVARQPYPDDSRATDACLTDAGLELLHQAQAGHLADVQRLFFDRLTVDQVQLLADVFARLGVQGSPP
ncbi:MAG: MarR family winged helix-turn-helix transcriptional regulator [Solirubrobacteraceae bacterium]